MNFTTFLFWSGVIVVAILVSYMIIEWLKSNRPLIGIKPKRQMGFHAIKADHEALAAV
jgi:hypothetical protein